MIIEKIDNIIEQLKSVPGISKTSAEKIAFYMINNKNVMKHLFNQLTIDINAIQTCEICFGLSLSKKCNICLDKNRDKKLLIVEKPIDIFYYERKIENKFHYHVLGGLIQNKKSNINLLNIESLLNKINDYDEIIIALPPNLQGIVTSNFLKQKLHHDKVTQLALGIPIGSSIDYLDNITINEAIKNRIKVK